MSILKILKYPDDRLRIVAKPIEKVTKSVQKIVNNMFETMHSEDGIGLAATQVNVHLQIIVINNIPELKNPMTLINPKIVKTSGKISIQEGCLSISNYKALIPRSSDIVVTALNYFGEKIKIQASSLLAICIQHEIDHLIGKLLIDYKKDLNSNILPKVF
ncbi:peptide deformylase [Buchnera aphidicola (Schlechtendalia chinensis)]|uniref:Peptide deformylase n=1 Tax=Buchnera aphidicola subsp. Schlechtendalia chinensis TaxID=118110 RepID=A0A172WDZ1_BUCSC|nr:peptide deformylase [Buchnera aphidicola]ANF17199.1 peptide deformylase [Buchnera aphidicola (Schlechtendalia chinensis)]